MHPCLFAQIQLTIWTNTIVNLEKYILHLVLLSLSIRVAAVYSRPAHSTRAYLPTGPFRRALSALRQSIFFHTPREVNIYTHTHIHPIRTLSSTFNARSNTEILSKTKHSLRLCKASHYFYILKYDYKQKFLKIFDG